MKHVRLAGLLAIVWFGASGCVGAYTNIDRASDGSYTVTKVTQGPWRVSGEVYRCEASGASMTCTELGGD
jgi:hypothetical protein